MPSLSVFTRALVAWTTALWAAVPLSVSADFFIGGHFGNGATILRVDESGQVALSWGGVYESVGGFTLGNSGTLYAMENRLGFLTVRGWDPLTGAQINTLTDTSFWGPGSSGSFGLPLSLATGPSRSIYAVGQYWDPTFLGEPGPPGPGIARLQENQFVSGDQLQPWISYGSGGARDASDLAVDLSGDLFLSDRNLGVLKYSGTTGEYLGLTISLSADGLKSPDSVVFGTDGLLYVLDSGNSIHVYDPATGNRVRSPITAESGLLNSASSLDAAPDGTLYVLSSFRFSVLKIHPVTGDVLQTMDLSYLSTSPGSVLSPSLVYFQVPEPTTWVLALVGIGWTISRSRR